MSKDRLYSAAFGFNTDRRVKPVHFATGFFLSILGRHSEQRAMNRAVALTAGGKEDDDYSLASVSELLKGEPPRVVASVSAEAIHALRKHLSCLADNDEAVFPAFAEKAGFGCNYSICSQKFIGDFKDNDGFAGHFTHKILEATPDGRRIIELATEWLTASTSTLHRAFQPLLDAADEQEWENRYDARFGTLEQDRVQRISRLMADKTKAVRLVCENSRLAFSTETSARNLIVALCIWLFDYLLIESVADESKPLLVTDFSGDAHSRMRAQSRWSYARLREEILESFHRFDAAGRFADLDDAGEQKKNSLKAQQLFGTLALRSGIAQPRASRVTAKHFEPQPDTLRVLVMSVLSVEDGMIPETELAERLFRVWGLCFGARSDDAAHLADAGFTGLDQDHDLTPNAEAFVGLLCELGLATRFSDGLVMAHSRPSFSP